MPKPSQQFTRFDIYVLIFSVLFFGYALARPKIEERQKAKEQARIEAERAARDQKLLEHTIQLTREAARRDSIEAPMRRQRDSIARVQKAEQDSIRRSQERQAHEKAQRARQEYEASAGFSEGYRDGYECGYDDGDCNESYGYSYLSDEILSKYSRAYCRGFDAGYRAGIADGREDYEYNHGI